MWKQLASIAVFLIFAGVSYPAYSASLAVTQERIEHSDQSVTVILSVRDTDSNREIVGEWFHCDGNAPCVKFLTTGEQVLSHPADGDDGESLPKAAFRDGEPLRLLASTGLSETPPNTEDGAVRESADEVQETVYAAGQESLKTPLPEAGVETAHEVIDESERPLEAIPIVIALELQAAEHIDEAMHAVEALEPAGGYADEDARTSGIVIADAKESVVADHGPSLPPRKLIEEQVLPNIKREEPVPTHERSIIPVSPKFESPRTVVVAFRQEAPSHSREVRDVAADRVLLSRDTSGAEISGPEPGASQTHSVGVEEVQLILFALILVLMLLLAGLQVRHANRAKQRIQRIEEDILKIQRDILALIDRL